MVMVMVMVKEEWKWLQNSKTRGDKRTRKVAIMKNSCYREIHRIRARV